MQHSPDTVRPVYGRPEASPAEPCDEHCDPDCIHHVHAVGWDLSFGSRINFHPRDTSDPRMVVSLQLSDDAVANRMVYREVTDEQVAAFAWHLLDMLAAKTGQPASGEVLHAWRVLCDAGLIRVEWKGLMPTMAASADLIPVHVAAHSSKRDSHQVGGGHDYGR